MRRHKDSTLMSLTKAQLIDYVRMAEHNQDVAEEALRQQAENVKDWEPVVRCKNCRWWKNINAANGCGLCKHSVFTLEDDTIDPLTEPNDFCSYGERRNDG